MLSLCVYCNLYVTYQDEHGEEERDGADHAGRGDGYRASKHARVQEPGQRKPENQSVTSSVKITFEIPKF